MCPEESLEESIFLEKKVPLPFLDINPKTFCLLPKSLRRVVKTAFFGVYRKISRKVVSDELILFNVFGFWAEYFRSFVEKSSAGGHSCFPHVSRNNMMIKSF